MGMRLVRDDGEEYWFTFANWERMLAFAVRHGWQYLAKLDRGNWNGSLKVTDEYAFIGCAALDKDEARTLAEALDQGFREDPSGGSVAEELEVNAELMRKRLPDYSPTEHAASLLEDWGRFREFARGGGFRVDLTD